MNKTRNTLTKKLVALILAFALITSTAIMLGFGIKSVSASAATAASEGVERSGLGLSVNAITTDYLDLTELKDGSPIFDKAWLASQVDSASYVSVNSSNIKSYKGSEFETIAKDFVADLGFNESTSLNLDLFAAATSSGFEFEDLRHYKTLASHYYYLLQSKIERYTLSLPNYSSDLSNYRLHLNTNYVNALQKVFNGQMTYDKLFNTYGTHVILKGVYGGMLNMHYSLASKYYDVGGKFSAKVTKAISASISNVVDYNLGANFNINTIMNCVNDFGNHYKAWSGSVANSPVLIAPTSDGLVPLWELLPSSYSSRKTEFKNAFKKYAEDYIDDIYWQHLYFKISSFNGEPIKISNDFRENEVTIKDNGIMKQHSDKLDLNQSLFGCDIYRTYGYNKVVISVTMEMKEINKGYQHICLYLTEEEDKTKQIEDIIYEYGGNKLVTDYSYVTHTFKPLSLSDITDDNSQYKFKPIVIRYSASGSLDDDWCNRNCTITATFYK